MSILGDTILRQRLKSGSIVVQGRRLNAVQPNSIDITLGRYLKQYDKPHKSAYSEFMPVDLYTYKNPHIKYDTIDIQRIPYILHSKQFVLAVTYEYIEVPIDLACTLEGKSSVGRFGLFVVNAGRVDSGWKGKLTLELFNAEDFAIELTYGMPIGQLVFQEAIGVSTPYGSEGLGSKYQGDTMPEESKLR